jgi:integrase
MQVLYNRWTVSEPYRKRNSPFFYISITDQKTGKRERISTKHTNKKFIDDWVRQYLDEKFNLTPRRLTFDAAFKQFMEPKILKSKTKKFYEYTGAKFSEYIGAGKHLDDVTRENVELFIKQRHEAGRKYNTLIKIKVLLKSFFEWCIDEKLCTSNPVRKVKIRRGAQREGRPLTVDEARSLIALARSPHTTVCTGEKGARKGKEWKQTFEPHEHLWLCLLISFHTGLRRSNVQEFRSNWLDLDNSKIVVPGDYMKNGRQLAVPLTRELAAALKPLKERGSEYLWGDKPADIHKSWNRVKKRSGLGNVRFHDTRTSFATWLSDANISWPTIKTLLGHTISNADVTGRYAKATWQSKVEAIKSLPDLLTGVTNGKLSNDS